MHIAEKMGCMLYLSDALKIDILKIPIHIHTKHPSMMAELFSKMPLNTPFFVIRKLDMRGMKVEIPSGPVRSGIHCFFFITGGEALLEIGEDRYYFKKNECAVIPAGHSFAVRYFDNCTGYMGGFNTDYIQCNHDGRNLMQSFGILRQWSTREVLLDEEQAQYVTHIMDKLCSEQDRSCNQNIIRANLSAFLTEMEESVVPTMERDDAPVTNNEICNKYVELVFARCNYSIHLSEYAEKLNVTHDFLNKTVRQVTGKSPLDWIREAVLLEAKVLLRQTSKTVNEISDHVGMTDPSYFSRFFKKQTGCTPLEYRKHRKS